MERTIKITYGAGKGGTTLAAFDAALFDAGIANHNLIHLSSIIPEGFIPIIEKADLNYRGGFGDKMYVVIAEKRETRKGHGAWAGLGWVVSKSDPKRGLFVEHCGESEEDVIVMIKKSLSAMTSYRKEAFGPVQYKTVGAKCEDQPVCALVAAVYETAGWSQS